MHTVSVRHALRSIARYVAAWSPLVVILALLIGSDGSNSATETLILALGNVAFAALLGLAVIAMTTRWRWPSRLRASFFLAHTALAAAYAAVWNIATLSVLAIDVGGIVRTLEVAAPWIFFQTFHGMLVYFTVVGITWARLGMAHAEEQRARVARADTLRVQAELATLRGQLDPHFLFNTLHSVSVLVRRDPRLAETALERLASLLRYVLDHKRGLRDDVLLADELAFVNDYLALETIRYGERLHIERNVSAEALVCSVPSFALQPLVENAIKHAIAPRAQGGTLSLHGHREGNVLVLEVRDDGPGRAAPLAPTPVPWSVAALDAASVAASGDVAASAPRSFGIGLDALSQRLQALYGGAASLSVSSVPGVGFTVSMRLPA